MLCDEHLKNANRSQLRRTGPVDLLLSRKVQRLKSFAEISDFQGKPTESRSVAQPSWP
jgi:hypothetical protein